MQLCDESIDLWTIPLNDIGDRFQNHVQSLSAEEHQRAARFRNSKDGRRFTLARGSLRSILGQYLGTPANSIQLSYNAYGKPRLAETHQAHIEFNLSHSGDYALCALTKRHSIGIDIEKIRNDDPDYYLRLATRFFSRKEFEAIDAAPENDRTLLFFACWTRKEAYLKRHGLGLRLPLSGFTVNVDPTEPAYLIETPWQPNDLMITRLLDLPAPRGYQTALAVASPHLKNLRHYTSR
ncbi:MAG: 4'-phosphopantetheinyl transferase superfamily protein [Pseudomonadota bacterium]|nr:4'-phosphopantetheinyl transferase superfamily protein [Pseudomonadota bacterium]